jgi:hypothetical protein
MNALIHIGIPKSGTSSIQAFLAMNRAPLAAQGILYAPFNPAFGSQFELPVTALEVSDSLIEPELERRLLHITNRADQKGYVAQYAQFLDGLLAATPLPRFIASSEHIHAWITTPERIAALDIFLRERFSKVTYLVYLRPQEELVTSTYSEAIRRGARHDLAEHLSHHGWIDHWRGLEPWLAVVGPERLKLRLMVRDALAGGDLLEDFCAAAGIAAAGLQRPDPVNAALGKREVALRRRLNALLPVQSRSGAPHPVYRRLLRLCRPLCRGEDRLALTAVQMAEVRMRNAKGNEMIRARFFSDRPQLF